jgi:hypothetical protein
MTAHPTNRHVCPDATPSGRRSAMTGRLLKQEGTVYTLHLTRPEVKILYTALKTYYDDLGREEGDIEDVIEAIFAKLPSARTGSERTRPPIAPATMLPAGRSCTAWRDAGAGRPASGDAARRRCRGCRPRRRLECDDGAARISRRAGLARRRDCNHPHCAEGPPSGGDRTRGLSDPPAQYDAYFWLEMLAMPRQPCPPPVGPGPLLGRYRAEARLSTLQGSLFQSRSLLSMPRRRITQTG